MEARPIRWAKAERAVEGGGWSAAQVSGLNSSFTSVSLLTVKDSFGGKVELLDDTDTRLAAVDTSRLGTWFIERERARRRTSSRQALLVTSAMSDSTMSVNYTTCATGIQQHHRKVPFFCEQQHPPDGGLVTAIILLKFFLVPGLPQGSWNSVWQAWTGPRLSFTSFHYFGIWLSLWQGVAENDEIIAFIRVCVIFHVDSCRDSSYSTKGPCVGGELPRQQSYDSCVDWQSVLVIMPSFILIIQRIHSYRF